MDEQQAARRRDERPQLQLLVNGTSTGATRLAWIDMAAIAAALRESYVRERLLVRHVVGIDAVPQDVVGRLIERGIQDSRYRAQRNVNHVIRNATAIWITRRIPS